MKLKQLSEIVWRYAQQGRAMATNQTFRQADIEQYCSMAYGNMLRQRYYENKKMMEDEGTDFYSGDLDTKNFDLGEANYNGMRRADIPEEVLRLPKNSDIVNVYPVGGECKEAVGEITQVMPGEENFYLGAEFSDFLFFVQKGRGINTYHVPPCIKQIAVERVYITEDLDIPNDMAFDIANFVLGITLKIKDFIPMTDNSFNANRNQLRYQIEEQQSKS